MAIQQIQEPIILQDFTGGMLDSLSVADSLMPHNSVRKGINVLFDRPRGSISQRSGTTKIGSTLSGGVDGIHNFRNSDGINHELFASVLNKISVLSLPPA